MNYLMQVCIPKKESGTHKHTDEELVRLFIETRYDKYFEILYGRYVHKVQHQCFKFVKDRVSAEDLTQDIFLKLIFKLNSFQHFSKFSTWLYTLSHNHCVDHLDSFRRKEQVLLNMEIPSSEDNQGNVFESDDTVIVKLKVSLNQLTIDEKGLLQMKYIDDISIRDIANLLETTESAIKMRLSRSKEKLRKNYKKQLNPGIDNRLFTTVAS